jgi:hypothetical protein
MKCRSLVNTLSVLVTLRNTLYKIQCGKINTRPFNIKNISVEKGCRKQTFQKVAELPKKAPFQTILQKIDMNLYMFSVTFV